MIREDFQGLRDDIEALYEYVDRSNFNLKIVDVMVDEIKKYVIDLIKCCEVEEKL